MLPLGLLYNLVASGRLGAVSAGASHACIHKHMRSHVWAKLPCAKNTKTWLTENLSTSFYEQTCWMIIAIVFGLLLMKFPIIFHPGKASWQCYLAWHWVTKHKKIHSKWQWKCFLCHTAHPNHLQMTFLIRIKSCCFHPSYIEITAIIPKDTRLLIRKNECVVHPGTNGAILPVEYLKLRRVHTLTNSNC